MKRILGKFRPVKTTIILTAAALLLAMACGGEETDPVETGPETTDLIEWPADTPEPGQAEEDQPREAPSTEEPNAEPDLATAIASEPTRLPTRAARPEAMIPTITPLPTIPLPTIPMMIPRPTIPMMIPRPTPIQVEDPAPAVTPGPAAAPRPTMRPTRTPGPTATPDPNLARAREMADEARTMLADGDYSGALETLAEAEKLLGRLAPWISPLMADAMSQQGRDEQAAVLYTHAINHTPGNGEYLVKRAKIRLRQDDTEAAEQDALEATRLESRRWEIHRGPHRFDSRAEGGRILTELYVQSQDYREAHRHANAVIMAAILAEYPAAVQERLKERRDWLQDILRARERRGKTPDPSSTTTT